MFSGPILPITLRSQDADPDGTFEQRIDLKNDLGNYRLNSSILLPQHVGFWVGNPSTWAVSEGIRPRLLPEAVILEFWHPIQH